MPNVWRGDGWAQRQSTHLWGLGAPAGEKRELWAAGAWGSSATLRAVFFFFSQKLAFLGDCFSCW